MAWTAQATAVANAVLSSAFWNTNVRNDLNESATAKVTTAGDLVYATAANALARLGIGSAGQVLSVSGGVPAWANPTVGVWQSSDSAAVNNSTTKVNTQLTFAMGANDVWAFDGLLYGTSGTTQPNRYGWSLPTGATFLWRGEVIPAPFGNAYIGIVGQDWSSATDLQTASYGSTLTRVAGIMWGNNVNSGTAVLQFAQWAAEATNNVFKKGSHLRLAKIA